MNKTKFITLLFVISLFCQQQLVAQKQLTLEDIYKNNLYGGRGVGQLRWMKDNKGYSTLEYNAIQKGMDIMLYDVESDAKKVLISASQLTPKVPINRFLWQIIHGLMTTARS
jgi:dipeptidyl-peptidase-4